MAQSLGLWAIMVHSGHTALTSFPLSTASLKLHVHLLVSSLVVPFNCQPPRSAQSMCFKSWGRIIPASCCDCPHLSALTLSRGSVRKLTNFSPFFSGWCDCYLWSCDPLEKSARRVFNTPPFYWRPLPWEGMRSCCSGTNSSIRTMGHWQFPRVLCWVAPIRCLGINGHGFFLFPTTLERCKWPSDRTELLPSLENAKGKSTKQS